ncbi:MAG: hypothetical protein KatS3mg051_0699 [Anaerolineae bacterium]|nr:MAG: hypothetical protein KatS3mg051_0699 [Anaerolineae bacterium]
MTVRVLFVCQGNICRSPMAEAVFRHLVEQEGLSDQILVDSAGTSDYHLGERAHPGTRAVLRANGIEYDGTRATDHARGLPSSSTTSWPWTMRIWADLRRMAPPETRAAIRRFLDFAADGISTREVPDPYYNGQSEFEYVYRLVRRGAEGLLAHIRAEKGTVSMTLPVALRERLAGLLGAPVENVRPEYGGDINQAARLEVKGTPYFVKWHHSAPPQMFSAEAHGLRLLAEAGAIRVPAVIAWDEARDGCPAFLLLEYIETGGRATQQTMERFGAALAELHRHTAPHFGLDRDNFIGRLPQPNTPCQSWATFYAEQRLGFQMELARRNGRLPARREKAAHPPDRAPARPAGRRTDCALAHSRRSVGWQLPGRRAGAGRC